MKKLIALVALVLTSVLSSNTVIANDNPVENPRTFAYLDELNVALSEGASGELVLSAGCGIVTGNDGTFTDASSCDPTNWVTYGEDGAEIFAENYSEDVPDAIAFKLAALAKLKVAPEKEKATG